MELTEKRRTQIKDSIENLRDAADRLEIILKGQTSCTMADAARGLGMNSQRIAQVLDRGFHPYIRERLLSIDGIKKIACTMRLPGDKLLLDVMGVQNCPDENGKIPALPDYDHELLWDRVKGMLSDREWIVMKMRYGYLEDNDRERPAMTYDQIGKEFNVTQERIRQILAKAIRKCRNRGILQQTFCEDQVKIVEEIERLYARRDSLEKRYDNAKADYLDMRKISPVMDAILQAVLYARNIDLENEQVKNILWKLDHTENSLERLYHNGRITTRTYRALVHNGINTVEDIQEAGIEKIMGFRNIGSASIREIKTLLSVHDDKNMDILDMVAEYVRNTKPRKST